MEFNKKMALRLLEVVDRTRSQKLRLEQFVGNTWGHLEALDSSYHYESIISNIKKYAEAFKNNDSDAESYNYDILFF